MTFSPKTFSADILEITAAFQPREENLNEAVLPLSLLHSVKLSNFPIQLKSRMEQAVREL
jgi:hypothetical protein